MSKTLAVASVALVALYLAWDPIWRLLGVRSISPSELKAMLASSRPPYLADARTSVEYRWFHIPGAESRPALAVESDVLDDLPRDTPIVVLCMTGHRSPVAAWRLGHRGFTDVSHLHGGMLAWRLARGEVSRGEGK